jgi:hypothetical protein
MAGAPENQDGSIMIGHLSPRECDAIDRAARRGEPWARVLRAGFLEGARLRLGIDRARAEGELAAVAGTVGAEATRAAIAEAARWCVDHRLLLMGFAPDRPDGEWRHFLAVG